MYLFFKAFKLKHKVLGMLHIDGLVSTIIRELVECNVFGEHFNVASFAQTVLEHIDIVILI